MTDLVRRALGASEDLGSRTKELSWAASILTAAELELWRAQPVYDRSHSVRVARRVEHRLATTPWSGDGLWLAAALLHDVGKVRAGLTLEERVVANLVRRRVGLVRAREWAGRARGPRQRIGSYLTHGEIGASMIRAAGGREELAAFAEVHQMHRDGPVAGIPAPVVAALLAADTG